MVSLPDYLASVPEILRIMSDRHQRPTDHVMEKITQIYTVLQVKVEELRHIFSELRDEHPYAQLIDTVIK